MTAGLPRGVVVINDGTDRTSWLEARKDFITATQAAAIAGSHPYTKLIDVWNEKTDPEFNPDLYRNRWLEERAANGTEREPEIIAWASADNRTGGSGAPFETAGELLTRADLLEEFDVLPPASTPDGRKLVKGKGLVLIEAKTSQQEWDEVGIPQHVLDQAYWQLYTTGAVTVWVALEIVRWEGRGAGRHAVIVRTWLQPVQLDQVRLDYVLGKVEQFRGWFRTGTAPESDVDLRELDPFESEPDDLEALLLLDELGEIQERIAADTKRAEEIKARVKVIVDGYDGRRVWLISNRFIAKLGRFGKAKVDTKALDVATLKSITTWEDTQRVEFIPNPEYVAPAATDRITE